MPGLLQKTGDEVLCGVDTAADREQGADTCDIVAESETPGLAKVSSKARPWALVKAMLVGAASAGKICMALEGVEWIGKDIRGNQNPT